MIWSEALLLSAIEVTFGRDKDHIKISTYMLRQSDAGTPDRLLCLAFPHVKLLLANLQTAMKVLMGATSPNN